MALGDSIEARSLVRCAALAFAFSIAAHAAAGESVDEAQARQLFDQGRELADKGDWPEACRKFSAAHALHSTGGTALQAANCYEHIAQSDKAIEMYQYILDHRATEKNAERVSIAEERIAALKKPAPAFPPSSAPASASPVPPPATSSEPSSAPDASTSPNRVPAYVSFGIGGAGVVVGAIFGVLALSQASTATKDCKPDGRCPASEADDASAAKTKGWVSTIGFGVGVVGVATGIILLATGGKGSKSAAVSPHGMSFKF